MRLSSQDFPPPVGEITVRYEILDTGIYRFDYTTGKRALLATAEARDFYRVVKLYKLICDAMMMELTEDGTLKRQSVDLLQVFLDARDNEMLSGIAVPSRDSSIGGRDERGRRAHLLTALDRVHSLSEKYAGECWRTFQQLTSMSVSELAAGSKPLPLAELQTFVGWQIEDGQPDVALKVLENVDGSVALSSPGLPRGEMAAMRARALLALGDWHAAQLQISIAVNEFRSHESDPHVALRGLMRAHSLELDRILMGGTSVEELRQFQDVISVEWNTRSAEPNNVAAEVRFLRMTGRIDTALAAIRMHANVCSSGDGNGTSDLQVLSAAHENLSIAYTLGRNVLRSRLEREEIRYDLMLNEALAGQSSGEDILEYDWSLVGRTNSLGWTIPRYVDQQCGRRIAMLGRKLVMIDDSPSNRFSPYRLGSYKNVATMFANFQSVYWYCESLAVLCALGAQWSDQSANFRRAAEESYRSIGRLDRWTRLDDALTSLPHDYDEFRRKFAYFLTW